jgi:hypothetical protein
MKSGSEMKVWLPLFFISNYTIILYFTQLKDTTTKGTKVTQKFL